MMEQQLKWSNTIRKQQLKWTQSGAAAERSEADCMDKLTFLNNTTSKLYIHKYEYSTSITG